MGVVWAAAASDRHQMTTVVLGLLFIGAGIGVLAVGLAIILGMLLGDDE